MAGTDTFNHDTHCPNCRQELDAKYHYYDRAKRNESNLAYIREKLGVTGRPNRVTLQRIDDLLDFAAHWLAYTDAHKTEWENEIARQEGRR